MTRARICVLAILGVLALAATAAAQPREVTVAIPAGVGFLVADVSSVTPASGGPMQISFSTTTFKKNDSLRISVIATSSTFAGPGTTRIPAAAVSWTATGTGGVASGGTLSSASYSQVYQSGDAPTTGTIDVSWLIGPIAAPGLRAGTHTLTVRWRLERM